MLMSAGLGRMLRLPHNPSEMDRAREFGIKGIGDIVLAHFAGAPTRHVEEAVIEGEIDVGDQRRYGFKPLQ